MRSISIMPFAVLVVLLSIGSGTCQTENVPDDRRSIPVPGSVKVDLGLMLPSLSTTARIDLPTLGLGTDIDFEDTLGLDERTTDFRADIDWRVSRRSHVRLDYIEIDRSASQVLATPIQFGDIVVPAGTGVNSFFDSRYIFLIYGYSFLQDEESELGASLGVNIARVATGLGTTQIGQLPPVSVEESITVPYPLFGVYGSRLIAPRTYLRGEVQYNNMDVADISGWMLDYALSVDYYPNPNYGFGIGYNYTRFKADSISDPGFLGSFDYKFQGLTFFASTTF